MLRRLPFGFAGRAVAIATAAAGTAATTVAAATAAAVTTATTAAVTAATATAVAAATTAAVATTATAAATTSARTVLRGVHAQCASAELIAIELLNGRGRIFVVRVLDECEAARTAALAVHRQEHVADFTNLREQVLHFRARRVEIEVPYKHFRRHQSVTFYPYVPDSLTGRPDDSQALRLNRLKA